MEDLKLTVERVAAQLQERMAKFEADQKSAPMQAVVSSGLPADYLEFKAFVADALSLLQRQVELLASEHDQMEMRTGRKMLLLHGVPETKDEDAVQVALRITGDNLALSEATCESFSRVQRMGRPSAKPRPLLVKYRSVELRDKAWFVKTRLKGSGITVSEFLTKRRHETFAAARDLHGITNCWTREGVIFVLDADGKRHRVTSMAGLQCIPAPTDTSPSSLPAAAPHASPTKPLTTPVTRPAATQGTAKTASGSVPLTRRAKLSARNNITAK